MTYESANDYLMKSYKDGRKHGFDCLRGVLLKLDSPQEKINIIHVAGTNGKGSVCAMLSCILREAGYKTGVFTSPHLHTVNERFAIDGEYISDADFCKYISVVEKTSNEFLGHGETLSYFEILTVIGFMYFYEQEVDYLILETGIGGRLDVTNIIEKPVLSVITSVGLDHTEYLGHTIDEITHEKGGIIKKNCPVVLYFSTEQVYNIISEVCEQKNSVLYWTNDFSYNINKSDLDGISFSVSCKYYSYENVFIKLLGEYQLGNAFTVLLAVHALNEIGGQEQSRQEQSPCPTLSGRDVLSGLSKAAWAGRMEIMSRKPLIILDGAHNYDAAVMLSKSIKNYAGNKSLTMIIGILRDKEYDKMVNLLSQNADILILTKAESTAKALEPTDLYDVIENKNRNIFSEPDYKAAVDLALRLTHEDGAICCCGSLYLVGDIRGYLNGRLKEN